MTTYYGFSSANQSDEPAWFCTEAAALRFARACGWSHADGSQIGRTDIESTDDPDAGDIMDTPASPWRVA